MKLCEFVLFGFCDTIAAGCRALLGVDLKYHSDAEILSPQVPSRDGSRFLDLGFVSCKKRNAEFDDSFAPLKIINLTSKNVSLFIINCQPSCDASGELVHWIINLLMDNAVKEFYILTSQHMCDTTSDVMYEMSLFKEKSKDFPDPPKELKSSDDFFNKLIQFIHVEKIPTSCFIINGKKATQELENHDELNSIQTLQTLAEELTAVKFNVLFSRDLFFEPPSQKASNEMTSMYL